MICPNCNNYYNFDTTKFYKIYSKEQSKMIRVCATCYLKLSNLYKPKVN